MKGYMAKRFGLFRKCFNCGNTSKDTDTSTCKCGSYMYLVDQIYQPKVTFQQKKS